MGVLQSLLKWRYESKDGWALRMEEVQTYGWHSKQLMIYGMHEGAGLPKIKRADTASTDITF